MKGPDKRIYAWYSATYTIRGAKWRPFLNRARDCAWQAKNRERSAIISTPFEGLGKATRGGVVNGSQSEFLNGTWLMSQNRPNTPLF
jgi:hypothetical protein